MKTMIIAFITMASASSFAGGIKYDQPVPKVDCKKAVLEETMKQEKVKLGIHEGAHLTDCQANVAAAKYNWFGAQLLEKSCPAKDPQIAKMIADFDAGRKTAEEAAIKTCKK